MKLDKGSLSLENDVVFPMDQTETTTDTYSKPLSSEKADKVDTSYTVDTDKPREEATIFETVKSFISDETPERTISEVEIDARTNLLTSIQVSTESDVKSVGKLPKEEIKKDVATDVSPAQTINEPVVRNKNTIYLSK